jgi:hypothetical protein
VKTRTPRPPAREPGTLFPVPVALTHKAYQQTITEALDDEGWWWIHGIRLQGRDRRWLTGVQGTKPDGWPDLLALRPGWALAIEVKIPPDKPTPSQLEWLERLLEAGCLAWVLRPRDDQQAVANWLARPHQAPERFGW